MFDILRESTVGEILNRISGGRILPYPDQRPDFVIPERYLATFSPASASTPITRVASATTLEDRHSAVSGVTATAIHGKAAAEKEKVDGPQSDLMLEAGPQPTETVLEQLPDTKGFTVVDWYGDDDPENPRNWSFAKRCFVLAQIVLLTYVVLSHFNSLWFKLMPSDCTVSPFTLGPLYIRRRLHISWRNSTFPK